MDVSFRTVCALHPINIYDFLIVLLCLVKLIYLFTIRYLRHLKLNVGNKAHVEASMCNQYLTEEASHFVSHYFEPEVRCRYRDLPMHDDGGENNDRSGVIPIFTHPVRFHGRGKTKLLDDEDLKIAHRYVLMNCLKLNKS